MVTETLCARTLARLEFAENKTSFGVIVSTGLVPPVVFLLPNYLIVQNSGWLETIWAFTIPLSRPALDFLGFLSFLTNWGDFLWPVYLLFTPDNLTLQPRLSTLSGEFSTHFGIATAGAVIAFLPVLVIVTFAQRQIVDNVTSEEVKG